MEGRYRRVSDLVRLTVLLRTRVTGISIDQVAERFEVSRRTAERMLAALRDCFPELSCEMRGGRKYWRLPSGSEASALQLPEELTELSRRVAELEQEAFVHREAEEGLRALADDVLGASAVGIFVLDRHFQVVWVNRALETYFGLRRNDVIGKDKRRLIQERIRHLFENPERFARRVLATYDDNTYIESFECHAVAGEEREDRWLEHWSQPITSGPFAGGRIEHYVDVTEHKRQRLLQLPKDLTAAMLSSIRGPMSALQDRAEAALASDGDARAALRQVSQIAERVGRAAEISIRLAQPEEPETTRVSMSAVLEQVEHEVKPVAELGGVQVRCSGRPEEAVLKGDPALIVAAMVELALNAIDAMPSGGDLELCAKILPSGVVRFGVCDSGPGVDPPLRERMFDRFFTTRPDRAGLGLAAVQDLALSRGGTVSVSQSRCGGAQIVFEIPTLQPTGDGAVA